MVQERGREEGNDSPSHFRHEKNMQKAGQRGQSEQSQTISISWMQSVGIDIGASSHFMLSPLRLT